MSTNRELPPEGGQHGNGMEVADDGSSLMLCSPLIPQRDSLVEIAETEYISYNDAGQRAEENYRSPLHQVHTVDDIDEEDDGERGAETDQASTDGDRGEGPSQMIEGGSIENDGDTNDEEGQPSDPSGTVSRRSVFRWPWSKTEEEKRADQKAKEKAEAKAMEQKLKKAEKLVWVPSPTNISLQTMWWGYRMSVISKRAALWLIDPSKQLFPSTGSRGFEQ